MAVDTSYPQKGILLYNSLLSVVWHTHKHLPAESLQIPPSSTEGVYFPKANDQI